jgi:hypothetical protein
MESICWGGLLAAAIVPLVTSCSRTPVAEAPSTPSAPPVRVRQGDPSPVPEPEGVGPGLGPWTPISKGGPTVRRERHAELIPFGNGALALLTVGGSAVSQDGSCPLESARTGCDLFSVARNNQQALAGMTRGDLFRFEAFSHPAQVVWEWENVSPASNGVYVSFLEQRGTPSEVLRIDFIDESGSVKPVLADSSRKWVEAGVADLGGGRFVVARGKDDRLWSGRITQGKEGPRLELTHDLGLVNTGDSLDNRSPDERLAAGSRMAWGAWQLMPWPGPSGDGAKEVLLAWIEASPNEFATTKPRLPKARHACGQGQRNTFRARLGERHGMRMLGGGCGAKKGRSDAFEKRLHLMRLSSKGEVLEDHTHPLDTSFDAREEPIRMRLVNNELMLLGKRFDRKLVRTGWDVAFDPYFRPHLPKFDGLPEQRLFTMSFDRSSGEALVLFQQEVEKEEDELRAIRVGSLGEARGESLQATPTTRWWLPFFESPSSTAVRLGDSWLLSNAESMLGRFLVFGGPRAGASLPFVSVGPEGKPDLLLGGEECNPNMDWLGFQPRGAQGVRALWRSCGRLLSAEIKSELLPGPISIADVKPVEGSFVATGDSGVCTTNEGLAVVVSNAVETEVVLRDERDRVLAKIEAPGEKIRASIYVGEVWNDCVVIASWKNTTFARWIRAGESIAYPSSSLDGKWTGRGPLLPNYMALPDRPGPPLQLPGQLVDKIGGCLAVATGPGRALLTCEERSEAGGVRRVGTRVLRY